MHFKPTVSSCHVDYDHVPIDNVELHREGVYALFYFKPGNDNNLNPQDFNEQATNKQETIAPFDGIPVLFIPGHAGEFTQGKGFASTTYFLASRLEHAPSSHFDVFSVDFNAELSVFHGPTLIRQAEFVTDMIDKILAGYEHLPRSLRPTSVILLGHSMGGIVARLSVMNLAELSGNANPPQLNLVEAQSLTKVNTIVTIGTPHTKSPWPMDETISRLYQEVNEFYIEHRDTKLKNLCIISVSGGISDSQVPAELSELPSKLISKQSSFFTTSTSIPSVQLPIAHLKLVRCKYLMEALSRSFYHLIDPANPRHIISQATLRADVFRSQLSDPLPDYLTKGSFLSYSGTTVTEVPKQHFLNLTAHCVEEMDTFSVIQNPGDAPYLCWRIHPEHSEHFQFLTSFEVIPKGSLRLVKEVPHQRTAEASTVALIQLDVASQPIISTHLNGSFALLKSYELPEYDCLILDQNSFPWSERENHFIILQHSSQKETEVVTLPYKTESSVHTLTHYRFPDLVHKHFLVRASASYSRTRDEPRPLFNPFFYQLTETTDSIETKFTSRRDVSHSRGTQHSLDFHQSSMLLSAPHLVLFTDIRKTTEITFELETNLVQMFRSYFIFIMPLMLGLPLLYLYISVMYWIRKGVYLGFFEVVSKANLFFLPIWILAVLFYYLLWGGGSELSINSVSNGGILEFQADDDVVLHTSIPLSPSFLLIAPICVFGWLSVWSLPPFVVVNLVRKSVLHFRATENSVDANYSLRRFVFTLGIGFLGCLIQPVVCLAFFTFYLFVNITIYSKQDEQANHRNYQISVFVLMFLVCAWKFACLFTGVLQSHEGIHALDHQWLLFFPMVQLSVSCCYGMLPRSIPKYPWLLPFSRFVSPYSHSLSHSM